MWSTLQFACSFHKQVDPSIKSAGAVVVIGNGVPVLLLFFLLLLLLLLFFLLFPPWWDMFFWAPWVWISFTVLTSSPSKIFPYWQAPVSTPVRKKAHWRRKNGNMQESNYMNTDITKEINKQKTEQEWQTKLGRFRLGDETNKMDDFLKM